MDRPLDCIMLIEDCEADTYLHSKIIRDVGVAKDVVAVSCGDEALEYLRRKEPSATAQPELIFLDINTPGREGWDFIQEFDAFDDSVKDKTVIVMLSGSLNPDDRDRALALPLIKEYRTKPLTRHALREIVDAHFPQCG